VALIQQFDDLAVLNRGSADLWFYVSDTHGRKLPAIKIPLGGEPTDLAGTGLYGRPLFVSNSGTDRVTILFGFDEGSFALERNLRVGDDPVDLALGQLFPDPEPEVAGANRGSDSVAILDGPHTRNYDSPDYRRVATYPAGDEPVAIRAVNLDGKAGSDSPSSMPARTASPSSSTTATATFTASGPTRPATARSRWRRSAPGTAPSAPT
jgi:hypothetical protein